MLRQAQELEHIHDYGRNNVAFSVQFPLVIARAHSLYLERSSPLWCHTLVLLSAGMCSAPDGLVISFAVYRIPTSQSTYLACSLALGALRQWNSCTTALLWYGKKRRGSTSARKLGAFSLLERQRLTFEACWMGW